MRKDNYDLENLIFSVNAILPLFLLMLLGFILKKVKLVSDAFFSSSNKISFKILLPVMLFMNIYETRNGGAIYDVKFVALASVGTVAITLLLMMIVPRIIKDRKKIGVVIQGIFRSNFLLFGVPVVRNMFGEGELWTTSSLLPLIIPIYNIFAVIVLSIYNNESGGKPNYKKTFIDILKNPLIVGAILAYVFIGLKIEVPSAVCSVMDDLSDMASPLALIALGGTIKFSSIKTNIKYIISTALGKLVMMPGIMLPIAIMMGYSGSTIGALLALFGSPVAVSSYVMSEQTGNDGELAGQLVAVSTVCSVITMFIWIYVLKTIGVL